MILPIVWVVDKRPGGTANARHNLLGVQIYFDLDYFDAILEQERFEWWYLRIVGLFFALPFIPLAFHVGGTHGWMIAFAGLLASLLGPRPIGPIMRFMELVGHMIEVIVASEMMGADREQYLDWEVRALTHYDQFKGWSEQQIEEAMLKNEKYARWWCSLVTSGFGSK